VFSRTEALEQESDQLEEMSRQLAAIPRTTDPALLAEARRLMSKLHSMNRRWNIAALNQFLLQRQKELLL
jgi:hypothetical protein